ncbi:helix-turn-helix domain-containing protein [Paenibacillus wynnii]|uniref:helix-turn-helix domain-containing protein n=1 Tax=Paenibacillus wynnii TaxID=268407 RepID=UPI00278D14CB|nr:helix-turn-helix transcriptional regulator [Paenibacillus wynnii]MDQ0193743.1 transcriptional regulator with XRE-family HTH domain [Paenibacillus wynnii]
MNVIGENIKRLRKIHNYNQIEFAKLIGISQGSLSDIEAGKSKPSIDAVISIHQHLGCSLEWLLKGNENHSSFVGSHIKNKMLNKDWTTFETELVNLFRELDTNNQIEVLEIIKIKFKKIYKFNFLDV